MEKAAEYAVILVADDSPDLDLISELKSRFSLSETEAYHAYSLMHSKYRADYLKTMKEKITRAWFAAFVSLIFGLCSAAFVSMGSLFYMCCLFIFGLGFSGALVMIARYTREIRLSPELGYLADRSKDLEFSKRKTNHWIPGFLMITLFLFVLSLFFYFDRNRTVDTSKLTKVDSLVISCPPTVKSTRGRNKSYWLAFCFKGYSDDFRMDRNIYDYGRPVIKPDRFQEGEIISIEILKKETTKLQDTVNSQRVAVMNIQSGGRWLIEHEYRNKKVEIENKQMLILFGSAYICASLLAVLWARFRFVK